MLEDDPVHEVQDVEEEQVFINLPQEVMKVMEVKEKGEEEMVMVATLVSLLSCCLVILLAGVLCAKHRQQRQKILLNSSLVENNSSSQYSRPPYIIPVSQCSREGGELYEYCSSDSIKSNSTSLNSSVYTTLPNGQLALVIPMATNNNINSSSGNNSMMLSQQLLSSLNVPHSLENFYVEIDPKKDFFKY